MRNLLLGCLLMVVTAVQAVTIYWEVPNAGYDWIENASVKFVYATEQFSSDNNYLAAKDAAGEPGAVTGSIAYDYVSDGNGGLTPTTVLGVQGKMDAYNASHKGFYYAVFMNTKNSDEYVVLGGKQYAENGANGIYAGVVDGENVVIDYGSYVDVGNFLGGTWSAAKTPEPTSIALLALGIAGVLLRRKVQ